MRATACAIVLFGFVSALSVCAADVFAVSDDDTETLCATWLGTARNIDTTRAA